MEVVVFGAISSCEISTRHLKVQKVGFEKGGSFIKSVSFMFYLQSWPIYTLKIEIGRTQAIKFMKLETSNGLPLMTPTNLPSTPPSIFGGSQAKVSIRRLKFGFFLRP
jgi:hypothetical protein